MNERVHDENTKQKKKEALGDLLNIVQPTGSRASAKSCDSLILN